MLLAAGAELDVASDTGMTPVGLGVARLLEEAERTRVERDDAGGSGKKIGDDAGGGIVDSARQRANKEEEEEWLWKLGEAAQNDQYSSSTAAGGDNEWGWEQDWSDHEWSDNAGAGAGAGVGGGSAGFDDGMTDDEYCAYIRQHMASLRRKMQQQTPGISYETPDQREKRSAALWFCSLGATSFAP